MARRRILWLIKGLGLGGAERLLVSSAGHLDRDRFEYEAVFLLPWKTALLSSLQEAGVRTVCLPHTVPYDLRIVGRLARFICDRRIDLVHAHLPYTGIVGRLAAWRAGRPLVYTEHNLQERYHALTRLANHMTASLNHATIAVSDEVRESFLRSRLTRRLSVRTVLNGVDADALRAVASCGQAPRQELAVRDDQMIVGIVSVFRAQKRLEVWLEAARRILARQPNTTFVIVGDGPSRRDLETLAVEMGLQNRVIFTGLRADAARLVSAFDVFMMSSIYEGLPVAVLEAMALARPVVATRVGGLPTVIEDGKNGFLVPPEDPDALSERVLYLLSHPTLRRAMGAAAAARVEVRFSIRRMVQATERVYSEVLGIVQRADHEALEVATTSAAGGLSPHGR